MLTYTKHGTLFKECITKCGAHELLKRLSSEKQIDKNYYPKRYYILSAFLIPGCETG